MNNPPLHTQVTANRIFFQRVPTGSAFGSAILAGILFFLPLSQIQAALVLDGGSGPGAGISVAPGTTIIVKIFYLPSLLSGPIAFDGVGLDLNWTPSGGAMAIPTGPAAGSFVAGMDVVAAPVLDIFTATGPLTPGFPLANPGMLPAGGAPSSLGGGGHYDSIGGAAMGGSSYVAGPPGFSPLDLMGAEFTITGAPGDTITFTPSGILPPGSPFTPGASMFISGGAHYYSNTAPGSGTGFVTGIDPDIGTLVVTIVPETGTSVLLVLGAAGLVLRRKRR